MKLTHRRAFGTAISIAMVAAMSLSMVPAHAATGDTLSTIIAVRDPASKCKSVDALGNMAGGELGTGIGFDGTSLILSCWGDNELTFVNPSTGAFGSRQLVTGGTDFGAMAFDSIGKRLWICNQQNEVGTVDLAANTYTMAFVSDGCVDGLAYDATDNTIWSSTDGASTVNHYQINGTKIQDYPVDLGGSGNSGLAVGGSLLYLGNDGGSEIFVIDKAFTPPGPTVFIDSTKTGNRRVEDLECDDVTFSVGGKAAIWSQDAYDNILNAYEIPVGSCPFGGGATTTTTSTTTSTSTTTTTIETPPPANNAAQVVAARPAFTG